MGDKIPRCTFLVLRRLSSEDLTYSMVQFSSVQSLSCVQLFATPWTAAGEASFPSSTPRVYSNSSPLSWWCHPTISSSITFFSCLQSFPASGSFLMSQLFASGIQNIGASSLVSVLPMKIHDWFLLELTGAISLQSVQGTLKSLLPHHSSKASVLQCSAFFMVQLSHPHIYVYMYVYIYM